MTKMNLSTKQTHRHTEHALVAKGVKGWGEMDWEFGVSRCKLLY